MSDNPFDELLREFQAAYARYGHDIFCLYAFTGEEVDADQKQIRKNGELLGAIPLGKKRAGVQTYWIYGTIRRLRWGRWTKLWKKPCDEFKALAARAGAFLPPRVRKQIPVAPAGPVAWWLAYMWWQKPPTEEDLKLPEERPFGGRPIWAEPFLESAEAIERGGLCGDMRPQEGGGQAEALKVGTDSKADAAKHGKDTGNRLKSNAKKELVLQKCNDWKWDGTSKQLSDRLKKECNLKVSATTLWRYLKDTKYDPKRRRAARTIIPNSHAIAEGLRIQRSGDDGPADLSGASAWTMPDDDENSIS